MTLGCPKLWKANIAGQVVIKQFPSGKSIPFHMSIKIHTQQYQQLMAENVHNSIDLFREWFLQGRDPKDRCPLPVRKLSQALIGMSGQRRHPFLRPAKRSKLCSGFGSGTG